MAKRMRWIVLVLLVVGVGCVALWLAGRDPELAGIDVSPSVANAGGEIHLRVVAPGARGARAQLEQRGGEAIEMERGQSRGEFHLVVGIPDTSASTVTIRVTATRGLWGRQSEEIAVSVNHPPRVGDCLVSLSKGDNVQFSVDARDADGEELSWTVITHPARGTLSAEGGQFRYQAGELFQGYDRASLLVADGRGGSATCLVEFVRSPDFFGSYSSLSEILLAPPTDIYGGGITMWSFEGEDARRALLAALGVLEPDGLTAMSLITGHAEHLTCAQASAAAASAWLMLADEEHGNLLTAGFGYLQDYSTPADLAGSEALDELAQSIGYLRDTSGLADMTYPGSVTDYQDTVQLIAEIATQFDGEERTAVRLMLPTSDQALPVVVPFFFLGAADGRALEITMPRSTVLGARFAELQKLHIGELRREMIAEKTRLRDTYRQWADEDKAQEAYLKNLSAANGWTWMGENGYYATQTRDYATGRVVSLDPPQWISYAHRLDQLPWAIEMSLTLAERIDELLAKLTQLLDSGHLQELNNGIMIDCFLRGWELPFGNAQQQTLYDAWLAQRDAVWAAIFAELARLGVPGGVISHGNTVFWARIDEDIVRITPRFILDASDGALILDPTAKTIQYLNWWEKRSILRAYESPDMVPAAATGALGSSRQAAERGDATAALAQSLVARWETARPTFEAAVQAVGESSTNDATRLLSEALTIDPIRAAFNLIDLLWGTYASEPSAVYAATRRSLISSGVVDTLAEVLDSFTGSQMSRPELLSRAVYYVVTPEELENWIAGLEVLEDAIGALGSPVQRVEEALVSLAELAGEKSEMASYLANILTGMSQSAGDLVERIMQVIRGNDLSRCLPPSWPTAAGLGPALEKALAGIDAPYLAEACSTYIQVSQELRRLASGQGISAIPGQVGASLQAQTGYGETAHLASARLMSAQAGTGTSYIDELIQRALRGLPPSSGQRSSATDIDEIVQRALRALSSSSGQGSSGANDTQRWIDQLLKKQTTQTYDACADLREQIASAIEDMQRDWRDQLGLLDWPAYRQQIRELSLQLNDLDAVERSAWLAVIAEEMFSLALESGDETESSLVIDALQIAEQAASLGLRAGAVQPLASWMEIEWRCGLYAQALAPLFSPERPLVLLFSGFEFERMEVAAGCDSIGVRKDARGGLVCVARPSDVPVLKITGFADAADRVALERQLHGLPADRMPKLDGGDVAARLLATSFAILPSTQNLLDALEPIQPLLLKCLAYGWYVTDDALPLPPGSAPAFSASLDRDVASAFLDESQYVPALIAVHAVEDLASLPRAFSVDPAAAHAQLAEGGVAVTVREIAAAQELLAMPAIAARLSEILDGVSPSMLLEEFPSFSGVARLDDDTCIAYRPGEDRDLVAVLSRSGAGPSSGSLSSKTSSGYLTLVDSHGFTSWLAEHYDASGKYYAWTKAAEAGLCLELGDGLWIASDRGLVLIPAKLRELLARPSSDLVDAEWEELAGGLFSLLFSSVSCKTGWAEDAPLLSLDLSVGKRFLLDVPVDTQDARLRDVLWRVLRGSPVAWVAETSNCEKLKSSLEICRVSIREALQVFISCPVDAYENESVRVEWDAASAMLRARIAELGIPLAVTDLSGVDASVAVARVVAALESRESQVLGFFHRAPENAFEVGDGGRLSRDALSQMTAAGEPSKFTAILGCQPLLHGLNDALIEAGVSLTPTIGDVIDGETLFAYLTAFADRWSEALRAGKADVPVQELLPETIDTGLMGEAQDVQSQC